MEEDEDGEKVKVLQGTSMMFPLRNPPPPVPKNLVYTRLVVNHFQGTMNPFAQTMSDPNSCEF